MMDLYKAIQKMRELTGSGLSFSFSYMSFSRSRHSTNGVVVVNSARLRPKKKSHRPEDQVLEGYVDLSSGEARSFYQCTLMTFQGQPVKLI